MSLISAITARRPYTFMIEERVGERSGLHQFLKRLMACGERAIFLIIDRGPAHIAKKTRAFCDSQHAADCGCFLAALSPTAIQTDRSEHLKADTVGRMTITDKADF